MDHYFGSNLCRWHCSVTGHNSASFASTPNGWTSDELGLAWVEQIFDKETRDKARRRWRLLFIDGHGSHLTMQFIQRCHELRILLGIYPPHSTHKLQPLDVGLFSPLANYYSQGLGHLLQISAGHTSIRRSDFFAIFWKAYEQAFDQKNILSAWKKTGIWPLDPRIVLDTLPQRPQTPPEYTNDKYMVAQVHQMSQRLQLVP